VHDAETLEPLLHLGGGHGTAVIGQQGAGQPAFLEGLREAVDEGLGALGQVPLQMAAQARAVIEHAEQVRGDPGALARELPAREPAW